MEPKELTQLASTWFMLRALVVALGESMAPAWWTTEFMNETGLRFLDRLYPRTAFQAAIHAAGRAASDVHDRAVGRIGIYHLFRLPESLELEVTRMRPDSDDEFLSELRRSLGRPKELANLLAALSAGVEVDVASGAKRIGTDKDLTTKAGVEETAAAYLHAFVKGKPVFPYFTPEPGGWQG